MIMTLESSTNNHSPRSPVTSAVGESSPNSRRRNLAAPWAQVVRGEPEPLSPSLSPPITVPEEQSTSQPGNSIPVESSGGGNDNAGGLVKPAWNKPSNGVVEEVSPVMGAVSWPALSESTRPLPKSSSDSSKPISDGSVSISQGPLISPVPEKQANINPRPKINSSHTQPVRQRSVKRGGGNGGGGFAQSGFSRPPPPQPLLPPIPPPFPVFEIPYGNLVPPMLNSSVREPPYKGNNWDTRPMGGARSQLRPVNDHSSQRNSSSRRGNFGPRPGGDGLYHNGHGGRRDQDRSWNAPRGSTARDVHISQQMAPPPARGFMRPPFPGSAPFIARQNVRPFGNPMGFDMASPFVYLPTLPPESFRGVPLLAHAPPPPMFFPAADPSLPILLVNQIDYYFSDANLFKDGFLRSNMDDQGRVPISLIASFPRVQHLTRNIQLILDSLRTSTVVEVQGDKVRRRNGWENWIRSSGPSSDSGSQTPGVSTDNLVATSL